MKIEKTNTELYTSDDYALSRSKLAKIFGLGLIVFAALVYLLTLSKGAFPGQSAELMVIYSGLEPIIAPAHTIWGKIVYFVSSWGNETMVQRLNLLSMLISLGALWLLFDLIQSVIGLTIERESADPKTAARAAVYGGAAATIALAFSVPFWMGATRLQYQVFDLFLLLLVFKILLWHLCSGKTLPLVLFSLLLGLSIVESVGIILFVPLFGVLMILKWLRKKETSTTHIFIVIVFGLIGLASSWLIAHIFSQNNDISLRGYNSTIEIVRHIFVDQLHNLKGAFPRRGWLNIALLVLVPFFASLAISRRSLNENREWGIMIMHAAFSVAVLLALGNSPVISPWGIFRFTGVLPVQLMVLSAATCGYLVAYWYIIIVNGSVVNIDGERSFAQKSSIWFGYFFGAITVIFIPIAAGINLLESNGRSGAFFNECTKKFISSLDGRRWVITDGLFDNNILLEANRTGADINIVQLQNNDNKVYHRYLKQLINENKDFQNFSDLEKAQLDNAADLGVLVFIEDWLKYDPAIIDKMAIVSSPDLIVSQNKVVVPRNFYFVAGENLEEVGKTSFYEEHQGFWTEMQTILAKSRGVRDAAELLRARVRRQVGFVANNAGVLLEDLQRNEEAFKTYNYVRALDPENVSAILNLMEMLHRLQGENFHADARETIEKSLKKILTDLEGRRLPIWSLSRFFGYVRSPLLFTQLGWAWAASGQPGIAIAGIKRAEQISSSEKTRLRTREAIAEVLWRQNDIEGSETIFEEIVKADPSNNRAMLSLARVQTRRGSLDKAREWLSKAQENGADKTALAFESATLDLASGRPAEARIKLSELTDIQPNNLQVWAMLGISILQLKDFDDVEKRVIPKMTAIAGTSDNYLVLIVKGQLLYQRGKDLVGARDTFERAAYLRPGITMLLEWILRIDFMLNDKDSAEEHARQILRGNRNNAFANYIMGSITYYRGRLGEAEDYYRRSINAEPSPEALNDLAELLRTTGNLDEAEKRIRTAISLTPSYYIIWDTLGGILMDRDDIKGAEEAFLKSIELFNDDPRVHMNYSRVLIKKGELIKARDIIMKVNARRAELSQETQAELAELVKCITPSKGKK